MVGVDGNIKLKTDVNKYTEYKKRQNILMN